MIITSQVCATCIWPIYLISTLGSFTHHVTLNFTGFTFPHPESIMHSVRENVGRSEFSSSSRPDYLRPYLQSPRWIHKNFCLWWYSRPPSFTDPDDHYTMQSQVVCQSIWKSIPSPINTHDAWFLSCHLWTFLFLSTFQVASYSLFQFLLQYSIVEHIKVPA